MVAWAVPWATTWAGNMMMKVVIATVMVTMTTIAAGVATTTTVAITMAGANTTGATTTDPRVTGPLEGLAAAVAASQTNTSSALRLSEPFLQASAFPSITAAVWTMIVQMKLTPMAAK